MKRKGSIADKSAMCIGIRMKVLIVSDSHGKNTHLNKVLDKEKDIEVFLHLGDLEGSEHFIETFVPCRIEMVSGNNDYFTEVDREKIIELGGYKIFMTHGHRYGVNFGTEDLKEAGRNLGVDIVMFGHTHVPCIDTEDDIIAINPGSISQPRQPGRIPTYIIMEIYDNGEVEFDLNYVAIS